ncbi:hypothetical protein EI555_012503, partial [Monodon monoceros]
RGPDSARAAVLATVVEAGFPRLCNGIALLRRAWAPRSSLARPLLSGSPAMAWTVAAAAAAGSRGARGALSAHTLLFDMPPALLGEFCAVLDSCDGALGWRGLGAALNPSEQSHQGKGFPIMLSKETASVTVDNVLIPEHNEKEVQDSYHRSPTEKVEDQVQGSRNSANILLDDQFQPKLTDFAMAHIRPHLEPQSSVLSMTSSSSKHLWYMPEEYIRQGKLSVKTDVYSFGIVIMEVLTGCKVVLDEPKHIQLRDLLIELLEKRGLDSCISFLDKKVHPCPRNFSAKLFSLAGQCAATRAKLRPSMDEVLTVLESTQASLYFAEDPPTSLKSFRSPSPLFFDNVPSIPVEDDENQNNPSLPHDKGWRKGRTTQKTPFECSQSEVTFLGFDRKTGSGRNEDPSNVPSSACEESLSPKHAAPSQDLGASGVNMDPSAEVPGHSYRSMPVEASCSSEFSWNECEQYKKASVSPEDKEESKYC